MLQKLVFLTRYLLSLKSSTITPPWFQHKLTSVHTVRIYVSMVKYIRMYNDILDVCVKIKKHLCNFSNSYSKTMKLECSLFQFVTAGVYERKIASIFY